jgi:Carboxypeptidase regulatory-like domain
MRRFVSIGLMVMLVASLVPGRAFAGVKAEGGTLTGVARAADNAPLPNYTVRVRRADDGGLAATTTTNQAGEFTFTGLPQGSYIVEIADAAGKVVGMSPAVAVAAGGSVSVTVGATAAGALTAGSGGGVSLFGLGKLASVTVIGAAGAIAVAAVVATREDASPSR